MRIGHFCVLSWLFQCKKCCDGEGRDRCVSWSSLPSSCPLINVPGSTAVFDCISCSLYETFFHLFVSFSWHKSWILRVELYIILLKSWAEIILYDIYGYLRTKMCSYVSWWYNLRTKRSFSCYIGWPPSNAPHFLWIFIVLDGWLQHWRNSRSSNKHNHCVRYILIFAALAFHCILSFQGIIRIRITRQKSRVVSDHINLAKCLALTSVEKCPNLPHN